MASSYGDILAEKIEAGRRNRKMTPKQRELARHALGLRKGQKISYRNRYWTLPADEHWKGLVSIGFAFFAGEDGNLGCFSLTREGAEAALDDGESLCLEDFPSTQTTGERP